MDHFDARVLLKDILDLVISQVAARLSARPWIRTTFKGASRFGAFGIPEGESAAVEPEAEGQLVGLDADAPEEL